MPITANKNIILHILIFKFLDSKLEDKIFCTCPDFNLLLISSWIELWFVKFVRPFKGTLINLLFHPAFWSWDMTMYSTYIYHQSHLVQSPYKPLPEHLHFPLQYVHFLPTYCYQHQPEADVYLFISSHPGLPEPSSKPQLKSNGDIASPFFRPFLIGNVRQILAYPHSAIRFIQTHLALQF